MPGWHDELVWPLSHSHTKPIIRDFAARLMREIAALQDTHQRNVVLMSSWAVTDSYFTLETALLAHQAKQLGMTLAGGPAEVARLQGLPEPADETDFTPRAVLDYRPIRHKWMRQVARTASWTDWLRLATTCISPEAIAVSHNGTLRSHAASSLQRVFYRHAESYIAEAHRIEQSARAKLSPPDLDTVYDMFRRVIAETPSLSGYMVELAQDLVVGKIAPILTRMDRDLKRVRLLKKLPDNLWAGSGGHPPARALSFEVKRRGGTVTLHDHGGAASTVKENESFVFAELTVADRFVTPTNSIKKSIISSEVLSQISSFNKPEILVGNGDQTYRNLDIPPKRRLPKRPNVLYVLGAFDGLRRRSPPSLPDPVKLDWWRRVSQKMLKMPIELNLQPHPGGVFRGRPNPVAKFAPISGKIFERSVEWADVLVIDITQTTTIPLSLCTDRHVVLIDYGRNEFNSSLQPLIDRRCITVKAFFNDRNLPDIDEHELETAIFTNTCDTDPNPFKHVYAG